MTAELARRGWVRRAGWSPVSRGLYRPDDQPGPLGDLRAWQLALPPSGAFTHVTGAVIRGWWTPPLPPDLPVFAGMCDEEARPRRAGLVVCRHTHPVPHEIRDGFRVATPAETLLAAARDLGLLDLVVLVDAALHCRACTLPALAAASALRRRGAPVLRRALRYADGRSESAWESVLRMLHLVCGVPVEPQYPIGGLRADLRINGTRRLPEYDGDSHRRAQRHAKDLTRERRLHQLGWERYGYSARVLIQSGIVVLRDADAALGRPHRPDRIRVWHQLLARSLFTAAGTARLQARWSAARDG